VFKRGKNFSVVFYSSNSAMIEPHRNLTVRLLGQFLRWNLLILFLLDIRWSFTQHVKKVTIVSVLLFEGK